MWWWGDSYMFGAGWMMVGLLVLVIVLIVAAVVALISVAANGRRAQVQVPSPPTPSTPPTASSGARAILDERYARGDITTEDYLERIEHLVR